MSDKEIIGEEFQSKDSILKSMCSHRILTPEEEMEYGTKALGGCEESVQMLVTHNIRLVAHIAKRFVSSRISMGDAMGIGVIGLMRAARKYDPSRGTKFSTFAVWHIKDTLLKAFWEQKSAIIHIPNYVADIERKHARGHKLTQREEDHKRKAESARSPYSDAYELPSDIAPKSSPLVRDNPEAPAELVELVMKHLDKLTPEDQYLLKARFGIAPNLEPLTLEELGKIEGVSKERIRQKEMRARERLRALVLEEVQAQKKRA